MSTISGNHVSGVVLTAASYTNPVTIASGAYILNAGGDAVLAQGIAWTIVNNGFVHADGTNNTGIDLVAGGIVRNDVGAEVLGDGGANGVAIAGVGGVYNTGEIVGSIGVVLSNGNFIKNGINSILHGPTYGRISGDSFGVSGTTGNVTNIGAIGAAGPDGYGVRFSGAGTVANLIGAITGSRAGISLGAGSTVTNFGTITTGTAAGVGVVLAGGVVTNGVSGSSEGLISGVRGLETGLSAATVVNYGTISGITDAIANYGSAWSVSNFGTISGGASGLFFDAPGSLTNAGYISGFQAITGGRTTVINTGRIHGAANGFTGVPVGVYLITGGAVVNGSSSATAATIGGGYGIYIKAGHGSSVANYGTIVGFNAGILLASGGGVLNGTTGSTTAFIDTVSIERGAGTLNNFGIIDEVHFKAGGSVYNHAGGIVDVVYVVGGGSITNFGTIVVDIQAGVGGDGSEWH